MAVTGASDAFHRRLRARYGLGPAQPYERSPHGLAYCGREFRAYPAMRIAEAVRFYAAMNRTWNAERLTAHLATARLEGRFEVRRMKRAYQRTLVLALALAAEPVELVVEAAEEFDEGGALALLQESIALVPRVLLTYGATSVAPLAGMPAAIDVAAYEALCELRYDLPSAAAAVDA